MSLELILNREGQFYWKCPNNGYPVPSTNTTSPSFTPGPLSTPALGPPYGVNDRSSCAARNNYLTSIYTVGVSANIASYVIWGTILDSIGPRITSCSSLALAAIGQLLAAISNDTSRNFYHTAFVLIGVGGIGVHLATFHLANTAPIRHIGLASAIFPCLFNVSAIVFPFMNILSITGMTLSTISILYAIVLVICLFFEFWIQEWKSIPRPAPPPAPSAPAISTDLNYTIENGSKSHDFHSDDINGVVLEDFGNGATDAGKLDVPQLSPEERKRLEDDRKFAHLRYMPNRQSQSFPSQVLSWYFLWTVLFIASVLSRNAFWQGNLARQLRSYGATTDTMAILISWFPALILILLPFLGSSIDRFGLPPVMALGCIFQVVYAGLALVPNIPAQIVTGVVAVLSRAVVMTGYFACVAIVCGYKTFGKVSGLAMAVGGVVNFTSIPLNSLINNQFNGDFFWVQVVELIWGIPLCLYPVYLWHTGKRETLAANATVPPESPQTARKLDLTLASSSSSV